MWIIHEFETLVLYSENISFNINQATVRVLVIAETSQAAAEEYTNLDPALHTQQLQNI